MKVCKLCEMEILETEVHTKVSGKEEFICKDCGYDVDNNGGY